MATGRSSPSRTAKRNELFSLLEQLAPAITLASNGDISVLLSSEFPYQKPTRSPVGELNPPAPPVVRRGTMSGQLDARIRAVHGAQSYSWRIARSSAPDTYVQTLQTTGGHVTFNGLTAGEVYSVQANAVGAAGVSDWSDDAELMAV